MPVWSFRNATYLKPGGPGFLRAWKSGTRFDLRRAHDGRLIRLGHDLAINFAPAADDVSMMRTEFNSIKRQTGVDKKKIAEEMYERAILYLEALGAVSKMYVPFAHGGGRQWIKDGEGYQKLRTSAKDLVRILKPYIK